MIFPSNIIPLSIKNEYTYDLFLENFSRRVKNSP